MQQVSVLSPRRRIVSSIGKYEYLRPTVGQTKIPVIYPQATDFGPGMYFDSRIGRSRGTAVDSTEPTWAFDVTLTDTGVPATNSIALQSAINTACSSMIGNTRILVPAGANYDGYITLKANNTGFKYGIIGSGYASLPTQSNGLDSSVNTSASRVSPSHSIYMPNMYLSEAYNYMVVMENGAKGCFMRGLNFINPAGTFHYGIFNLQPTSNYDVSANYPENIIISQCIFNPEEFDKLLRVFLVSGRGFACVDSYADNIGGHANESHFLAWVCGEGPVKCHNTWSNVSNGINHMIGGTAQPRTDDLFITSNIECTQNYFRSADPEIFIGNDKNKFEQKFGKQVLYEGNKFGYSNAMGQPGSVLIRTSDQGGTNIHIESRDVIIMHNYITGGIGGIFVIGESTGDSWDYEHLFETNKICSVNNLVYQPNAINLARCYSVWDSRLSYISAFHNTFVGPEGYEYPQTIYNSAPSGASGGTPLNAHSVIQYNVVSGDGDSPGAKYYDRVKSEFGTPFQGGEPAWYQHNDPANSIMADNLMNVGTSEPSSYIYDSQIRCGVLVDDIGYTDPDNGDFSLLPTSLGYQAAPGNKDIGVTFPLFNAVQSRVSST